jgi:hypothetical protein
VQGGQSQDEHAVKQPCREWRRAEDDGRLRWSECRDAGYHCPLWRLRGSRGFELAQLPRSNRVCASCALRVLSSSRPRPVTGRGTPLDWRLICVAHLPVVLWWQLLLGRLSVLHGQRTSDPSHNNGANATETLCLLDYIRM